MPRRLSTILLLSAASAAQAQQFDTLLPRPVALQVPAADSVPERLRASVWRTTTYCPAVRTTVWHTALPLFSTVQPALSRVAGVQVTPYSGAPDAWAAVRIRGVAQVTGYSQPLYVVDDVPVYNTEVSPETWQRSTDFFRASTSPAALSGLTPTTPGGNPLLDLPVADIERVEVLKGAAATARYGAQGGHGVIRITTRRGADGWAAAQPLRVRYTGYGGVQQVRQRYALVNAEEFIRLRDQGQVNSGGRPTTASLVQARGFVDWQDRLFRTAALHSHNLSLDGYTGATRYYAALDYLHQGGVLVGSRLNRASLRANVDQRLGQRLVLGLKVAGSQLDQRQPGPDASGLVQQLLLTAPLGTPRDAQGQPAFLDVEQSARRGAHAPRTRRLLAQFSATYQLAPGLIFSAHGSREVQAVRDRLVVPALRLSGYIVPYTQTETNAIDVGSWVADAALRYQHTFGRRHALTGSVSLLRQQFSQQWAIRQVTDDGTPFGRGERSFEYWVEGGPRYSPSATIGYVYDGRYELQASVRMDPVFWNGHDRQLRYPGAQLSWHLGREAFLADLPGLGDFTLYAGAGRTSGHLFTSTWLGYPFGPNYTDQFDTGLESSWLQGHLTVSLAAYHRRTYRAPTELLLVVPGQSNPTTTTLRPDVGLRNRGLELTVGSSWQLGPLSGSSTVAAALNRTRVEALTTLQYTGLAGGPVLVRQESIPGFNLQVGQPLAYYRVFEQAGFYPAGAQPGGVQYRDINQDGRISPEDTRPYGSGLPRYTLNLVQQLHYKRLQLDVQFDGLFGYQIYNPTLMTLDLPRTGTAGNYSTLALDYASPDNPNPSVPAPASNLPGYWLSRERLPSGSHLRLTQLQLSYALLQHERRQLSVWVGGQNLFVTGDYRGFDPNVASAGASPLFAGQDAGNYPVVRAWQLGVRGQF